MKLSGVRVLLLTAACLAPAWVLAQVTPPPTNITGSGFGTKINGSTTLPCSGGTCDIAGGSRRGANLFHSFGFLNVGTGDTANFLNDTGLATSNIIGRVNGGQTSSIFGTIQTTDFGSANLFLINPAGWIFGPTAFLNVGGSFHVSTADYLRFGDGTFFADNSPLPASGLTANPLAFGFLGVNPPALITVDGSTLAVPQGQTLSLVGGNVQVGVLNPEVATISVLSAPGGRVEIASVISNREMPLGLADSSTQGLGNITLNPGAFLDVSGEAAGSIVIRGGQLFANGATLVTAGFGDLNSAKPGIDIKVQDDITLSGGSTILGFTLGAGDGGEIRIAGNTLHMQDSSLVSTTTFGAGRAGDIEVNVSNLVVEGGALISSVTNGGPAGDVKVTADNSILISGSNTGILSDAQSFLTDDSGTPLGTGGNVIISTPSLTLDNGGNLTTRSFGFAPGGNITVQAQGVTISNGGAVRSETQTAAGGDLMITAAGPMAISGLGSGIFSSGSSDGSTVPAAGDIFVNAADLSLTEGGKILNGGLLDRAGDTTIVATNSIVISDGAGISSQAFLENVGQITISAPNASLTIDNGFINTSTIGTGNAGTIAMNVGTLALAHGGQITSSSEALASGAGGNVTITAKSVSISGTSPSGVPSSPFGTDPSSGIFSTTAGTGPGGNIEIATGQLHLNNGGILSTTSSGTADVLGSAPGNAGNINLVVDTLSMSKGTITTAAAEAAGGDITITNTGSMINMTHSQITTSVNGGLGGGGNITIGAELDPSGNLSNINPFDFITLNNSGIHANAFGGPGGNINIFTNVLLSSLPLSTAITASSALNTPGIIDIQATVTQFSNDVSQLPDIPLQATELLRATCAARVASGRLSSLVLGGRGGLPLEPGGLLPSPLLGADSAVSFDHHGQRGERLSFSPSNFSMLASDSERPLLRSRWDQFHLAKTTLGLDCSQ